MNSISINQSLMKNDKILLYEKSNIKNMRFLIKNLKSEKQYQKKNYHNNNNDHNKNECYDKIFIFIMNENNDICSTICQLENEKEYNFFFFNNEFLTLQKCKNDQEYSLSFVNDKYNDFIPNPANLLYEYKDEKYDKIQMENELFRFLFFSNKLINNGQDNDEEMDPYFLFKKIEKQWKSSFKINNNDNIDNFGEYEDFCNLKDSFMIKKIDPFEKWKIFIISRNNVNIKFNIEFLKLNEEILFKDWNYHYEKLLNLKYSEQLEIEILIWRLNIINSIDLKLHNEKWKKHLSLINSYLMIFPNNNVLPYFELKSWSNPLRENWSNELKIVLNNHKKENYIISPFDYFPLIKKDNIVLAKVQNHNCLLWIHLNDKKRLDKKHRFTSIGLLMINPLNKKLFHLG